MPEYLRLLLMGYGIDTPWLYVDADPPGDGDTGNAATPDPEPAPPKATATPPKPPADSPSNPVDVEALQKQIAQLKSEVQAKDSVVSKLRPYERNWKKVAADLNPERLTELQQAEKQLLETQQQQQTLEEQIRDAAAQEYTPKIQEKDARIAELEARVAAAEQRYELSTAFTHNGGIGKHFDGFVELAGGNFKRSDKGQLNAYDDLGNMVMVNDPQTKQDRAATPGEFIKMVSNGSLEKSSYLLSKLPLLKYTVEAYNRSSGSDLPRQNGHTTAAGLTELSQAELAELAFKS